MGREDRAARGENWDQDQGALLEEVTRYRRDLHRIPELDDNLPETTAYVRSVLAGLDCELTEPCPSSLAAFFDFGRPETVAVRADMDALPICEKTGAAYASTHAGCMHACGHDGHMAMALACAAWVSRMRRRALQESGNAAAAPFSRNVLFVFQPAEETTGGAQRICASGVFERYRVSRIFGMHLWPDLPAGTLASRPGALLARSSETTVTFSGVSAHIARWREGRDALGAAARFVVGSKWLARKLEQSEPMALRFGRLEAGTVRNAVAGTARVEGSLRVFSDAMFARAQDEIRALAQTAADEEGCSCTVSFSEGYPPVVNDEALWREAVEALDGIAEVPEPLLIAEDFSFYQQRIPGLFMLLGTGTGTPLHAETFDFDEHVLLAGVNAYRQLLGA